MLLSIPIRFKPLYGQLKQWSTKEIRMQKVIKIKGIKADWIMNELVGFNFLMKLLKTGNREVFESQYIKIVIQFLYESYSNNIWK